jgi:hypothetical protein
MTPMEVAVATIYGRCFEPRLRRFCMLWPETIVGALGSVGGSISSVQWNISKMCNPSATPKAHLGSPAEVCENSSVDVLGGFDFRG